MAQIKTKKLYLRGENYWADITMHNGQRIRKSLGTTKASEAKRKMIDLEIEIEDSIPQEVVTIQKFSADFFLPGSAWMERRERQGHTIKESTRVMYRKILEKYIWTSFGTLPVDGLDGPEAEDTVAGYDGIGNSMKNEILRTLKIVMEEAQRGKLRKNDFRVEKMARDSQRKDTLTDGELEILFPDDPAQLSEIWRTDFRYEPENAGLMFGTMFALMVSAGLRSGEARALQPHHIILEQSAIVVAQAIDRDGDIAFPKKGTASDNRQRAVIIPEKTCRMLERWMPHSGEFVFEFWGKPVSQRLIGQRFDRGLSRAGIIRTGRLITPHSLRYTYNTKMETLLTGDILRAMIGHRDESMTDHYSRPIMLDRVKQLQDQRGKVNQFW
jgi:integrase